MTDFTCPNGSGPQAGAPPFFVYDDPYVALKLGNVAGWLTSWAIGLPFEPQVTADLCSAGPPTELPTGADYAALAFPAIALASGAYRRFGNQIRADKWADLCQCNPPLTASCGADLSFANDPIVVGTSVALVTAWRVPTTSTGATITIHPHNVSAGTGYKVFLNRSTTETATGTVTLASLDRPSGGDATFSAVWTAGAFPWLQLWIVSDAGTWNGQIDWTLSFTGCTTSGPIPYTAPPPPAPPAGFPSPPGSTCTTVQDVCTALLKVSQKLDWLRSQVDLIQRQSVPFGYIKGQVHAGLAGGGAIATSGLMGIEVVITSYPAGRLQLDGTPPYIYDLGWVSVSEVDGVIEEHRVAQTALTWFPHVAGLATSIGYSFRDGVVATITELLREP